MPVGLGEATEMIGPFSPALVCWASLVLTVLSLGLMFFWTNLTAFARRSRQGQRKATAGSMVKRQNR